MEKYATEDGFSVVQQDTRDRMPGGISTKQLDKLNEWWALHKPINDPLSRDPVFHSHVVSHEVFELTKKHYHTISFNVFSQLLSEVIPQIRERLKTTSEKPHTELHFDIEAKTQDERIHT